MKFAPKRIRGELKEAGVSFETFSFNVYCVAGPQKFLPRYLKWRHKTGYLIPPSKEVDGLYFHSTARYGGVIWIPGIPRTSAQIGVLNHELGHAVIDLFKCRELPLDQKRQEPFCYAMGYGLETLLKGLRS